MGGSTVSKTGVFWSAVSSLRTFETKRGADNPCVFLGHIIHNHLFLNVLWLAAGKVSVLVPVALCLLNGLFVNLYCMIIMFKS